jgi:hypothetical protein
MTNITIELCAEDRARLDRILEALEKGRPRCENCVQLVKDICDAKIGEETATESADAPTPKETQPETETPTEPKNEAPSVTEEDIRSKYMSLATTPKKEQARTLIKLYADKISDIPADKLPEVLEKLNALEG